MKTSKKLQKLMNKGFRGYPIATIAYYGPDDKNATKVAVGIVPHENAGTQDIWLLMLISAFKAQLRLVGGITGFVPNAITISCIGRPEE